MTMKKKYVGLKKKEQKKKKRVIGHDRWLNSHQIE